MKKVKQVRNKKPTERVSFYIALSICVMAVGMALWSAYTMFSEPEESQSESGYFSSLNQPTQAVAQEMTGVTESPTQPMTTAPTQAPATQPTQKPEKRIEISETQPQSGDVVQEGAPDSLQAVLKVKDSLVYPVKGHKVIAPYSEESVYNATMKDYRAHPGCDFAAEEGESVYAMCDGTVENISVSELYGVIVEVNCGDFSVYYCGVGTDLVVDKGDAVGTGDTIGTVGQIPCENGVRTHVHIEVRVGDMLIDPLSVIDSEQ